MQFSAIGAGPPAAAEGEGLNNEAKLAARKTHGFRRSRRWQLLFIMRFEASPSRRSPTDSGEEQKNIRSYIFLLDTK